MLLRRSEATEKSHKQLTCCMLIRMLFLL